MRHLILPSIFGVTLVLFVVCVGTYGYSFKGDDTYISPSVHEIKEVTFFDAPRFFSVVATAKPQEKYTGSRGVVVSHHLLASSLIAETLASVGSGTYDRIVLIGPNHYEGGTTPVITSLRRWGTVAGVVEPDREALEILLRNFSMISQDEAVVDAEHSLGAIVPFVAHYFGGVPLVPLALSMHMTREEIILLGDALISLDTGNTLYIGSIDFSHYLLPQAAALRDNETRSFLRAWDTDSLFSLSSQHVDSPRSLVLLMDIMKQLGYTRLIVHDNKNSADYIPNYAGEVTTYFSLIFSQP